MRGRKASARCLRTRDRRWLQDLLVDGQLVQRVANRARALLALDHGDPFAEVSYWTGLQGTALWYLWRRYEERGVAAVFDGERSGRPPSFSPSGPRRDRARGLH